MGEDTLKFKKVAVRALEEIRERLRAEKRKQEELLDTRYNNGAEEEERKIRKKARVDYDQACSNFTAICIALDVLRRVRE